MRKVAVFTFPISFEANVKNNLISSLRVKIQQIYYIDQ